MKTEVIIETINGNKKSIRDYAYCIAEMSAGSTNAYVMAFDAENEILWTVQAGDGVETAKDVITWAGAKRVEIYDHSADMSSKYATKTEFVYITTNASLAQYVNERRAADYVVAYNNTGKDVHFAAALSDLVLQDDVFAGAVYCSNGDAAHTLDYPEDRDAIIDAINNYGAREIELWTDDHATAAARLDLTNSPTARIFIAGDFIFCPDIYRACS